MQVGKLFAFIDTPYNSNFSFQISDRGIYKNHDRLCLSEITYTVYRPLLLPNVLYSIRSEKVSNFQATYNLIDYPPIVRYERIGSSLYLTPLENRFEKKSFIIFEVDGEIQLQKNVELNRKTTFEIPEFMQMEILKGSKSSIGLQQGEVIYSLESWNEFSFGFEFYKKISCFSMHPYLSVKSILNPQNGFESLLADVTSGKFKIGHNRSKMQRLLNILRAALPLEEHKIMKSIFIEDPGFFKEIEILLFNENLLPYMSKKEIATILANLKDYQLVILLDDSASIERYRPYLSKNRLRALKAYKDKISNSPIWSLIEEDLRKVKQDIIFFENSKYDLWKEGDKKPKFHLRNNYTTKWSTLKSKIWVQSYYKCKLAIAISVPLVLLTIVVEPIKNEYKSYYFMNVEKGILILDDIPRLPHKVLLGGIDNNRNLIEGLMISNES